MIVKGSELLQRLCRAMGIDSKKNKITGMQIEAFQDDRATITFCMLVDGDDAAALEEALKDYDLMERAAKVAPPEERREPWDWPAAEVMQLRPFTSEEIATLQKQFEDMARNENLRIHACRVEPASISEKAAQYISCCPGCGVPDGDHHRDGCALVESREREAEAISKYGIIARIHECRSCLKVHETAEQAANCKHDNSPPSFEAAREAGRKRAEEMERRVLVAFLEPPPDLKPTQAGAEITTLDGGEDMHPLCARCKLPTAELELFHGLADKKNLQFCQPCFDAMYCEGGKCHEHPSSPPN